MARLATDATAQVRRGEVAKLAPQDWAPLKRSRWALLKRPANRTERESEKLSWIAHANRRVYRAHLLEESFLDIFDAATAAEARRRIRGWLAWASRSRLQPFIRLARTVRSHVDGILAFLDSRLSNARLEGMNNKIRLLDHRSFGFHSAEPLIATIYLCCGGIELPKLQMI